VHLTLCSITNATDRANGAFTFGQDFIKCEVLQEYIGALELALYYQTGVRELSTMAHHLRSYYYLSAYHILTIQLHLHNIVLHA
jgi:hypothetical protein